MLSTPIERPPGARAVAPSATAGLTIAVMLPCYNEEVAIGRTVADFRAALPTAQIYVFDNNSRDDSRAIARAAGAIVRLESRQGKGNVVRRMFADVDADIYVMADADATYEAGAAPAMVAKLLDENLDMVVGRRRDQVDTAYRPGHRLANVMLTRCLAAMFGRQFTDILSGYRVFSKRFVKTFPSSPAASRSRPKFPSTHCSYGCRSARSRLATTRDPTVPPASSAPIATACASAGK